MQVLVIEDEETIQAIIASFLQRYGQEQGLHIEVKGLCDAVMGRFELVTNGEAYDLVIMDVRLPQLSGDAIYAGLVEMQPEIAGRVLFISGYRKDLEQRFADRELAILDKPFHYEQFARMVASVSGSGDIKP